MRNLNANNVLFLVGSTYSLLNAIHIASKDLVKADRIDLIVFARDEVMRDVCKRLGKQDIFNNVFVCDYINNANLLWKVLAFLFPSLTLKWIWSVPSLYRRKMQYDTFLVQSNFYASLFALLNPGVKVYFIDEGISSYTGRRDLASKRSTLAKIFFRIKKIFNRTFKEMGTLLYDRNLYNGPSRNVIAIPKISSDDFLLYKKLYSNSLTNEFASDRRVFYLGSPFWGERTMLKNPSDASNDFEEKCESIVKKLIFGIGASNIVYRLHPIENDLKSIYSKDLFIDRNRNSWELYSCECVSNDSVLVSIFSTGLITPFLLFDKQPTLIFLYKLIGHEFLGANQLLTNLKSVYINPNKIYAPETMDELREVCKIVLKDSVCN